MAAIYYDTVNAQLIGETSGGMTTTYLTDELGSVVQTAQNASIINRYRYSPFGKVAAQTGPGDNPRFLWAGAVGYRTTLRAYASEYAMARHYEPTLARWTSQDNFWPTESAHAYANGRPVTLIDPSGNCPQSCGYQPNDTCNIPFDLGAACCLPIISCIPDMAQAVFSYTPNKQGNLNGNLSITLTYAVAYYGSPTCPPPQMITVSYSSPAWFSGLPGYNKPNGWCIFNHGPIPPSSAITGNWTIESDCKTADPGHCAESWGTEGYKFKINPHDNVRLPYCPEGTRPRGSFLVHPDGNVLGSQGCITTQSLGDIADVRSCFHWANLYGCSSIPLTVLAN